MSDEDRFIWLESVKKYVQETDAESLDLHHSDVQVAEVKSILECLADSRVTELNLRKNDFGDHFSSLSQLLSKSKLSKLNLSFCKLSEKDALSLFKILSNSKITDLNVSNNSFRLPNRESYKFTSYLEQSHLTALNIDASAVNWDSADISYFIRVVCASSITHLNIDGINIDGKFMDEMIALFLDLKKSSITHLSAASNALYRCDLSKIGDSLRESKLVELDLCFCFFKDRQIDILFEALVGTRITVLKLIGSRFSGSNNLFRLLKHTKIEILDLSDNSKRSHERMFDFPHFLAGTSVVSLALQELGLTDELGEKIMKSLPSSKLVELNIGGNKFTEKTLLEFSHVVTQTAIVNVNFSSFNSFKHYLLLAPSLSILGDLLQRSGIKYVNLFNFHGSRCAPDPQNSFWGQQPQVLFTFLKCVKYSCVTSLKLRMCQLSKHTAIIAFPNFMYSKVTHLDLGSNVIGRGLQSFATILKFTVITHLILKKNDINDEDVKVLAECLKETCIIDLNLGRNHITNRGAEFLALSLRGTNILTLKLTRNKIEDLGMKVLAENAATTLITTLKVGMNPGNMHLVETVIWNNRRIVLQFVRFFKQIAPGNGSNAFKFEDNINTEDCGTFLEKCLNFYDIATKHSSASHILSQEKSFSRPKEQIMALLFEEFPRQFVNFVVTKIRASTPDRINFLKKVEEMGLTQIVKLLISNRPIYHIDDSLAILYPFVYQLLNKYEIPICNREGELQEIRRIVQYFTAFSSIEGAVDVISMLKNKHNF